MILMKKNEQKTNCFLKTAQKTRKNKPVSI